MASPNTVPSDDGTTTMTGGGAQTSSDASCSPYKHIASGTLTQLTPDPGTENGSLPHGAAPANGLGSIPRKARTGSASTDSGAPLPDKDGSSVVVHDMAAGGRPSSERAESPLSLTDVKVEDLGLDPSQPAPALAKIIAATSASPSPSLSSKADIVRPNLPPPYGVLPPPCPPPYSSSQHPHDTPSLPPYTPYPFTPTVGEGGGIKHELLPVKIPSDEGSIAPPLPSKVQSPDLEESVPTVEMVTFPMMTYLGQSAVDAPRSETEASRKMEVMRQQAVDPLQVIIMIPVLNEGNILLLDPQSRLPLLKFPIKYILFCVRGKTEDITDCLCINVRLQTALSYHCHVFKAPTPDMCQKVFEAIGKCFKNSLKECEFNVKVEIHEDDGKGGWSPVHMDKDCFRLRPNVNKVVILTLSQLLSETSKPLHIERCFGLLAAAGKDIDLAEMSLLDNMKISCVNGSFSVEGTWNNNVPFLTEFNEETPKGSKQQYLTLAADFVIESVEEPVRFVRELKVKCTQPSTLSRLSSKSCTKDPPHVFVLSLKKAQSSTPARPLFSMSDLRNTTSPYENSVAADLARKASGKGKVKEEKNESHADEDDVVSGWGELEEVVEEKEELNKKWGLLLDDWEAKSGTLGHRPKELTELCRKGIPGMMRGLIWNYLSGAHADPQLKESYKLLVMKESPSEAENVIKWDMHRTFVSHTHFKDQEARDFIEKISKAYSVYDLEVGYCQGFSFIIAVLLLQKLPEEEAFSILVKLMYTYSQRDLFKANFRELMLMLYQLDKLVESEMADLSQHFRNNVIETHMFASQWFLTIFTAKFPLCFVYRVMDMFLCDGRRVLIAIALGLLKTARKDLLLLDFEGILNYFRVSLPKKLSTDVECNRLFLMLKNFKVTDVRLKKLEKDYPSFLEQQAQLEDPVARLERENKQLRDTVLRLEEENGSLAQEVVESKVDLRSQMDKLEERIDTLSKENKAFKTTAEATHALIKDLKEELQQSKDDYQKMLVKLTEDLQQRDLCVTEYKRLLQDLDGRHQKQLEEMDQELLQANAKLGSSQSSSEGQEASPEAVAKELRARDLEMELAQTKLELVSEQCKNQELQNQLVDLQNKVAEQQTGKNKKK